MMNIYDCFQYFDEDLLLDIRLNILNQYVKKFVITEATFSHNGNKKKLNFNIENFKNFKDKIEYIVVDKPPPNIEQINLNDSEDVKSQKLILNGMARDIYQREQLNKGLSKANEDDIILISDLDEIPNLDNLRFDKIRNKIIIFKQMMFYYKLNLLYKNYDWFGTKACKKKNFISPQWLREIKANKYSKYRIDLIFSKKKYSDIFFVDNGGWHFTYLKNYVDLEKKLLNFAHHHEFEISGIKQEDIKKMIEDRKAIYNHQVDQKNYKIKWGGDIKLEKVSNSILPNYVVKNLINYKEWLD